MAKVTMRQMLEAGVHFGHQTRYWCPKMAPYIFGAKSKIHIINLEKTMPLFHETMDYIKDVAANNGSIMFVGTKKAAQKTIAEEAGRCGMPYVNHRWLGGMLTNFKTIRQSIKRLKELESMQEDGSIQRFNKKEALGYQRELNKLERSLGGIKDMPALPSALFVIDVGVENIAVNEAIKLGIPVIGVVDTKNNPACVDYKMPGTDDSNRAIQLYVQSAAAAVLEGKAEQLSLGGVSDDDFVEMTDDTETKQAEHEVTEKVAATESTKTPKPAVKSEAVETPKAAAESEAVETPKAAAEPAVETTDHVTEDKASKPAESAAN
jgi:small subunit ribosomal protein S2